MNILKRIGRVFSSKANEALDSIEDPVAMTKQGIREMKNRLGNANEALAKAKAGNNKLAATKEKFEKEAGKWESDAGKLDDKLQSGGDSDSLELLIVTALNNSENSRLEASKITKQLDVQTAMTTKLNGKIKTLKESIVETENSLVGLEARAETAKASKDIAKSMSGFENDSTKEMLERMQKKVEGDEFLADAYTDLEEDNKTDADKIAEALGNNSPTEDSDLLAKFRKNRKEKA